MTTRGMTSEEHENLYRDIDLGLDGLEHVINAHDSETELAEQTHYHKLPLLINRVWLWEENEEIYKQRLENGHNSGEGNR